MKEKEKEVQQSSTTLQQAYIHSTSDVQSNSQTLWSEYLLSNWFFIWVFPIILKSRHVLFKDLHFSLRKQETAAHNVSLLQESYENSNTSDKAKDGRKSIYLALKETFGVEYAWIAVYKLLWSTFTWLAAYYFLSLLLTFLGKTNTQPLLNGHLYAMALGLCGVFSSIAIHQQYAECNRVAVKVKSAVMALVYRKALRLSRVKGGAGEVINILSSDVNRLNDAVLNFHFLWAAFYEVLLILGISFYLIGYSAFPAVFFVAVLLPVQVYLGRRTDMLGREQALKTTERVHIMSELLTAIKLIKFYAWEKPFAHRIGRIRKEEMELVYKGLITKVVNYTIVFAIPVLVALSCLSMYVALGNKLTATVSFTTLSVFNTLRYPFFMLPMAVKSTVGAFAAVERLDDFLELDEVVELVVSEGGLEDSLYIQDSSFKWDGVEGDDTLKGINLRVQKGFKVGVVGDVGCGKSSLIASLLGQIRQTKGPLVKVFGKTSYMSQEAWLLNMTLRENILFGSPLDMEKYQKVIRVCGLERDLQLLVAGDETEIAERGANLSGGQRQRVSLARSVYNDSDIILLDDPLSAVDQHVGRLIFEECFMSYLKKRTVIVSLNQLQYLNQLDYIVYMKDGMILLQGTYDDLLREPVFKLLVDSFIVDTSEVEDVITADPPAADLPTIGEQEKIELLNTLSIVSRNQLTIRKPLNEISIRSLIEFNHTTRISNNNNLNQLIKNNEMSVYSALPLDTPLDTLQKGKLVQDDESTLSVGFGDFVSYAKSGSGVLITILVVVSFSMVHLVRIGGDYWLRLWVPRIGNFTDQIYIGVYGLFAVFFSLGALLRGLFFTNVTTRKAAEMHDNLFDSVMHAPMSFFDTTPIARILSCFAKHQLNVDDSMLDAAMQALQYLPLGLGAFFLCSILIEYNYIPAILILLSGYLMLRVTRPADLATKALEAVTKPPIYSNLTATLDGLMTIRSYNAQLRFDALNLSLLDANHSALFAMQNVKSLQALTLDLLSSSLIYTSALLLIVNQMSDSVAGLTLSNALQMLVFVQWTIRQWSEVEAQMSSVGQLVYYAKVKPEAPFEVIETKPAKDWPEQGEIAFKDVSLRYQKGGVMVLKEVNLTVYPREKVGIVGRTGSGKSTLLISLLRIVELETGLITLDGVDVSKIGLNDLRTKIAIIPQEAVMFVGTIRSNLDPFFKSSDEEIWVALDSVFLGDMVRKSPLKLETEVTENGKSVSQGQRQLLCIARAILSKAKILVLDEATASLDAKTDSMIQEAIKKNFGSLTMLTIAHRLNTIIDSDRVLVMDAGLVVEFDEPLTLLDKPNGVFKSLVDQTGIDGARNLREMAIEAKRKRVESGIVNPERKRSEGAMNLMDIAAGHFE